MKRNRLVRWAVLAELIYIASPLSSMSADLGVALKPEKSKLEVGTAGMGTTSLPLLVALEAGYFTKRGLAVSVNPLGATVAVQGIISGAVDIYQGGTAASRQTWRAPISFTSPPPWTETH
jgi:ABC-type nitrate/sulfonate/bicarbonate transport system substrate-binding protein